jgi:hypothetical protein
MDSSLGFLPVGRSGCAPMPRFVVGSFRLPKETALRSACTADIATGTHVVEQESVHILVPEAGSDVIFGCAEATVVFECKVAWPLDKDVLDSFSP